ncbi:MAG: peptidase S9 [Gemmatimonadota bacterium]
MRGDRSGRIPLVIAVGLAALALAKPPAAVAQYFGRNKVQYESFDFEVLKTEHFDIYHYGEEAKAAELAGRMAERWYARLSRLLDHELGGRQPLILYASHPHFEQTNAIFGNIGESTGGVTEVFKRRIVLPFASALPESDHVLGHELVHAFQFDITRQNPAGGSGLTGIPTAVFLPLWFIEGMAEYLSVGPVDPHTAMWIRDAARECCELPTIRRLSNPKFFPYRFGQAFWAFVAGRWGDEAIGKILKLAGTTGVAETAIATVLQMSPDSISAEWHASIREMYAAVEEHTEEAERFGRVLISKETGSGGLNVGPALSPDGSRIVFLSEKDLFAIEMFVADAETGKIERRLTKNATDPHFESLQFINSAGAWSADGRRFAFAAVSKGQPVLIVLDMESGKTEREIKLKELGEVFTPTWSPDGRSLAFSAQVGGVTDLFVVDVESGDARRLTDDVYADLQPAWSPDGASIAFVTDRFATDLNELAYGNYRLALVDAVSGEIQPLPVFGNGKHINPQWSADGQSLYFLTDVSGITNIYRYEFAGGNLYRVTNLFTGVSGITSLSPALSSAAATDRLVYTVYEEGDYNLHVADSPEVLRGEPISGPIAGVSPAVLPPQDRGAGLVLPLLRESRLGLADTLTFERTDYSPSLGLDFVGQPSLFVGADQFGAFISGGISLYFSDMLGNRNLLTILQVNGGEGDVARSSAGILAYQNQRSRWNWGAQVGQLPIISRRFASGFTVTSGGDTVFVDQADRFWQINREASLGVAYPFNRSQRVEFSAGFRNVDFAAEREVRIFDPRTGQLLDEQTVDLTPFDTISSLNLGTASTALVFDNTLFGGTGPILGQRYRFQATGTFGSLNYVTALADYRRYIMPARPITLAGRILHFGRYGNDGEDRRLSQLFIGYPSLVRGYNDGSFEVSECDPPEEDPLACPVFDQLLGSRLAVANIELRVPVFGFFGLVPSPAAPPVEFFTFFDAGVAWTSGDQGILDGGFDFLGIDRDPVTSYGVGARINLFGFLIGEIDFVHPNGRPEKGWYTLFHLSPAF